MKSPAIGNQAGQMTLEMILIMAILLGMSVTFSKWSRDNQLMRTLVEGPWKPLQGMIQDGTWAEPETAKGLHPNLKERHGSFNGDAVPN